MSAEAPPPHDARDLPVQDVLADLVDTMSTDGLAVLEAPPGAGKTTLVPLALADAGWLEGRIIVLEPRRIAVRAAAGRMAYLDRSAVGDRVGYTTREDRRVSARTQVEVVTEGVLLRRLQRDPTAEGIGAVVFDEFHERSIPADLTLAFALECRRAIRDDLRLLVMSATLDGDRVAALLGGAEVIRSTGRTYPVTTRHESVPRDADIGAATAAAARRALPDAEGDLLAFLPGQREIRRAAAALGGCGAEVLPLYGALPLAEQQRALDPSRGRRIILATDIAESSLTVPGVRVVIDGGLARRPQFDPASGMSRLQTVRISRASADQRRGRAARQGPGLCVRLWPTDEPLAPASPASITEEDLTPTALEVAAWGTPVEQLALLDQPPSATWAAAHDLLASLGALDDSGRLTGHGRDMAGLPLHPRLAHMVLSANPGQRRLAAELAALLGERDILLSGDVDLERRVRALRGRKVGRVRQQTVRRVRADADRIHRKVGGGDGAPLEDSGLLVAHAYPDRIAIRRERRGAFVLAGGRGAWLAESDSLAGERLLAVANVDRGQVDARIHLAAALDEDALAPLIRVLDHVAWERDDVVAQRQRRVGGLVLSGSPLADPDPEQLTGALVAGVRSVGLHLLTWTPAASELRDRLRHLHRSGSEAGWPAMDDDSLLQELEGWLAPFLGGVRRRGDLQRVSLIAPLMSRVPYPLHGRLDVLAPSGVAVPSGSTVRIDYSGDRPVLAVKLQEMFGSTVTPVIAGEPVVLHLLSPARRPVQVTDDLAGFWDRTYPQVRSELRARYAKHPWPEDPLTAQPTARTTGRRR